MALDLTTKDEYLRLAQQQQQVAAYWMQQGDLARARLALDVVNWYYQQLAIPLYTPAQLLTYTPNPKTPAAAAELADSLPVITDTAAIGGGDSAGAAGSDPAAQFLGGGGGSGSQFGGASGNGSLSWYCDMFPDDPICSGFNTFGPSGDYCDYFPNDPACSGSGGSPGSGGGGNGPTYIYEPVTITINQQGLTLGDVASRISGALAAAAGAIATAVDSVLGIAMKGIQSALTAIGNELMKVFSELARLAGKILQVLKTLLLGVLHGLVKAVQEVGKLLKDVVNNVIVPALQALQHLREWLMGIYKRFLRPLLIVLQDVRKVLAILRVFHIGFAQKLDNILADIQAKISAPLLYVLRGVNTVANYINLILDARLFIQRPLFLASLNANKGSSLNLLINAMNPTPNKTAVAALQAQAATLDPAANVNALKQFLQDGTGTSAEVIQQQSALFDTYLKQGVQ